MSLHPSLWSACIHAFLVVQTPCDPWTVAHHCLYLWDFPGEITEVGCHFPPQGIFLTQGLNPSCVSCIVRWILYHWCQMGSPSSTWLTFYLKQSSTDLSRTCTHWFFLIEVQSFCFCSVTLSLTHLQLITSLIICVLYTPISSSKNFQTL